LPSTSTQRAQHTGCRMPELSRIEILRDMEMDSNVDVSPCRWAASFQESAIGPVESELVDLPLHEQVARGQALLRLLWEPLTPQSREASSSSTPVSRSSSEVPCKDFFAELANLFSQEPLKPAPSHSMLLSTSAYDHVLHTAPHQRVLNLNECLEDSGSVRQKAVTEQRCLDLNDLLDGARCMKRSDTPHSLSDASTNTPRDPIEDISIYEVLDSSLIEDIMPVHAANLAGCPPISAAAGTPVLRTDAWQYLQPGPGCVSTPEHYPCPTMPMNQGCTHLPTTCHNVNVQMWPLQWQWPAPVMGATAPLNLNAPKFSTTPPLCNPPFFATGHVHCLPPTVAPTLDFIATH